MDNTQELQEVRTFEAMRRDAEGVPDGVRSAFSQLREYRRDFHNKLSIHAPGSESYRALVDEGVQKLDDLEWAAYRQLQAMRTHAQNDRMAVKDVGYRPGIYGADQAEAKASALMARIDRMSPADVKRELQAAVRHDDPVELAAWALCAPVINARFPATQKVRDVDGSEKYPAAVFGTLIRHCEEQTGDPEVKEVSELTESAMAMINNGIQDLTITRAAHDPSGGIGSELLTRQYGHPAGLAAGAVVAEERRYDRDAILERLAAVEK